MDDTTMTDGLSDGERLANVENIDDANGTDNVVPGAESGEPAKNGERRTGGMVDVPSRRLSLLVEGRDYLKYRETFERLLFSEKMTPAHKDAEILKLAMACLIEKMDAVSAVTGNPFVKAGTLAE